MRTVGAIIAVDNEESIAERSARVSRWSDELGLRSEPAVVYLGFGLTGVCGDLNRLMLLSMW